jgi:hypothetical protein
MRSFCDSHLDSRRFTGDDLRIPTIMGDSMHSAAADADALTGSSPVMPPSPQLGAHVRNSDQRARAAWGAEGEDDAFDAGVGGVAEAARCAFK